MELDQEYTFADYIAALRRRRGVFFAVAAPFIVIALAISSVLPDEFASFAKIDVNLEGSNVRTLEPIVVSRYADQYISKLKNRVLADKNFLDLANDPELFDLDDDDFTQSGRIRKIKDSIHVSVLTQMVMSPVSGREVDLVSGVEVASVAGDPNFAFKIADHAAKLFLQADRESRTEQASSTLVFLNEQMRVSESEILALENDVANFKVSNACCLPELVNVNMSIIQRAERDIENLQPRVRTLEQERLFLQTQLNELGQRGSATDRLSELEQEYTALAANYGLDHPDVARLRREITAMTSANPDGGDSFEITELKIRLSEAEQRYSDQHPDIIRYKKELAALESKVGSSRSARQNQLMDNPRYLQLRAELNSVNTQLSELRRSQPVLRQKIAEYEDRLARTPQVESAFQAIDRKLQSARKNFEDLQRRAVIARQSEALESTDFGARLAQLVPTVMPRSPSGPPRKAILILGMFLALSLGIGVMLFVEMTDSTVRSSKDVSNVMNMVPIASIPVIQNSLSRKRHQQRMYIAKGAVLIAIAVAFLLFFRDLI